MRLEIRRRPIRVRGFRFSGVAAGIKGRGRLDLALVVSDVPAVAAAAFTASRTAAPPVLLGRRLVKQGYVQALVVNSGNANAGTGRAGRLAAQRTCEQVGAALRIPKRLVFPASTGKIGVPLPDLGRGVVKAASELSTKGFWRAASAIVTTDAFPKVGVRRVGAAGTRITVAAMAKGAGMIAPKMATLLAFFFTDAALTPVAARRLVRQGMVPSFNRVTVDGDTSTNDTALILANGLAGNRPVEVSSPLFQGLLEAVRDLAGELAVMVVADGEGATRVVEVVVGGARNGRDADLAARAVAESVLVRTALHGGDPNWGRVLAAVGRSGARVSPERMTIAMGGVRLLDRGLPAGQEAERRARKAACRKKIEIRIDLGYAAAGKEEQARLLTCDLSLKYVRFNSAYST